MELPFARELAWNIELPANPVGERALLQDILRVYGATGTLPIRQAGGAWLASVEREGFTVESHLKPSSEGTQAVLTLWIRDPIAIRRFGAYFLIGRTGSAFGALGLFWYLSSRQLIPDEGPNRVIAIVAMLGVLLGFRRFWSRAIEPRIHSKELARMESFLDDVEARVEGILAPSGMKFTRLARK